MNPALESCRQCAYTFTANQAFVDPIQERIMRLRSIIATAAFALASSAALAFHCPADMKKIDAELAKNPKLSAAQMEDVKKFRAEGEAMHKAGKHQDSVDTLAKAMKILNIQ